jgi:LysM repeat protein
MYTLTEETQRQSLGQIKSPGRVRYLMNAAGQWLKVFWLFLAVLLAGFMLFFDLIADSILSTPHPEIVYGIFAVAIVAVALFSIVMNIFVTERTWFRRLVLKDEEGQLSQIDARKESAALTPLYRLIASTKGRPVVERQRALEHEVDSAETELIARLAIPNLLSGGLVGLGLVGTFIGLLQTLAELSGVFAALGGGGAGGDAASMFSDMISKLQGPMQGMGTAFVASLYGLLGSLIIGITGLGVRRVGEKLFSDIRLFVSEELYADAYSSPVAVGSDIVHAGVSPEQWRAMVAALRDQHQEMRSGFDQWMQRFEAQVAVLGETTQEMNAQLLQSVNGVVSVSNSATARLQAAIDVEEMISESVAKAGADLSASIEGLRADLKVATSKDTMIFGRAALILTILGGLSGLAAVVFMFVTLPAQREILATMPNVIVETVAVKPYMDVLDSPPEVDSKIEGAISEPGTETAKPSALATEAKAQETATDVVIESHVPAVPAAEVEDEEINAGAVAATKDPVAPIAVFQVETKAEEGVAKPIEPAVITADIPDEKATTDVITETAGPVSPLASTQVEEIPVDVATETVEPFAPAADVEAVESTSEAIASPIEPVVLPRGEGRAESITQLVVPVAPALDLAGQELYTIQIGDTLAAISRRSGVAFGQLLQLNPGLANPDLVLPGQIVILKD